MQAHSIRPSNMALNPPEIPNLQSLGIPTKIDCPIKYTFTDLVAPAHDQHNAVLVVFVNGLGLPQAFWQPCLQLIQTHLDTLVKSSAGHGIFTTTYDRYGQGHSQPTGGAKPFTHDMLDAVKDLGVFLDVVKSHYLARFRSVKLFFVAHSIGVPLARLFCQHHPGTLSAMLLLDSNMANSDFVSLYPDDKNFSQDNPPPECTLEQLRAARAFAQKMFHPSAPNAENLDRSTLPSLLPLSDGPRLRGAGRGGTMLLRVVGHDPEAFIEESAKLVPRGLTEHYVQPAWHAYNNGLLKIAENDDSARAQVLFAPGCGHFIQRDNPAFVARQVMEMLKLLCTRQGD